METRRAESTEIMRRAMYESGAADKSTEKLEWAHNPKTLDQAIAARKEEDQRAAREATLVAGAGAAAEELGHAAAHAAKVGEFVKHAVPILLGAAAEGGTAKALGAEAKDLAIDVAGSAVSGVASAAEAHIGGPIVAAGKMTIQGALRSMQGAEELRDASDVVGMDLAATELLDLDQGFKNDVSTKYDGQGASPSCMRLFKKADGTLTELGKKELPKLQAACDQGTKAALDLVFRSDEKVGEKQITDYLRAHPDVSERIKTDVAFAKGWDQVMFLQGREHAADKLEALERSVKARDAWSAQGAVVRHA